MLPRFILLLHRFRCGAYKCEYVLLHPFAALVPECASSPQQHHPARVLRRNDRESAMLRADDADYTHTRLHSLHSGTNAAYLASRHIAEQQRQRLVSHVIYRPDTTLSMGITHGGGYLLPGSDTAGCKHIQHGGHVVECCGSGGANDMSSRFRTTFRGNIIHTIFSEKISRSSVSIEIR